MLALVSREWRGAWADRGAYVLRGVYAGLLLLGAIASWVALALFSADHPERFPEFIRSLFTGFCRAQFGLATVLAAMTFARAVCREQERGTMDLLILSPLTRMEILVGKLAGEFLGLIALVASGIPVIFMLLPLGGLSPLGILSVQGMVLAHVLVVGGLSVAFAAALGRALPVMICTWVGVLLLGAGAFAGRWWLPGGAWVWNLLESISTYSLLEEQLSSAWPQPMVTLKALGLAAMTGLLFCGLGSLVLERRWVRGPRAGLLGLLAARIRRFAGSLRGERLFRPLVPIDHPLMRRECSVDRDLAFRVSWIALVGLYVTAVRIILGRPWSEENHYLVSGIGLGVAFLVAVFEGALAVGYDRRRGNLQVLLAAGVSPEDLVRARMAGLVLRALYLVAIPAVHLILIGSFMKLFPPLQLLWRIPALVAGILLGVIFMMEATLRFALSQRRPEVAAVLAMGGLLPAIGGIIFLEATLSTFAVGLPLMIFGLVRGYTWLVLRVPRWVLH